MPDVAEPAVATPDTLPAIASMQMLNEQLRPLGLPELALVHPMNCVPQEVNARYMDNQTMQNLIKNVKRDGRLESVPLVAKREDGKYDIISGHHRCEAAQKAGLALILVMIAAVKSESELRAKQLSHNAIAGKDDDVMLRKMYESIADLSLKVYSGLQDSIESINFTSLNFKAGSFKEFVVAFLPENVEQFDKACELIEAMKGGGSDAAVRLAPLQAYDTFTAAIRKVKRAEDIKSNGTALVLLVEMAMERMAQIQAEREKMEAEKDVTEVA